jgi:hypothetical protein
MDPRIHANCIARAGLHAEATVDAAQGIDLIADGILFDGVVRILTRLYIDTIRGAGRGA